MNNFLKKLAVGVLSAAIALAPLAGTAYFGFTVDCSQMEAETDLTQIDSEKYEVSVSSTADNSAVSVKSNQSYAVMEFSRVDEAETDSVTFLSSDTILTENGNIEISFGFSENGAIRALDGFPAIVGAGKKASSYVNGGLTTKLLASNVDGNLVFNGRNTELIVLTQEERERYIGQRIDFRFVIDINNNGRSTVTVLRKLPGEEEFTQKGNVLTGSGSTWTYIEAIEKLIFTASAEGTDDVTTYNLYDLKLYQKELEVVRALPEEGVSADTASITFNATIDAASAESAVKLYCGNTLQTKDEDYTMTVSGEKIIFSNLRYGKEYTAEIDSSINEGKFEYCKPSSEFDYDFTFNTPPYNAIKTITEDFDGYDAGTPLSSVPTFSLYESDRTTGGALWKNDLSLSVESIGENKALRVRAIKQSSQNRAVPFALGLGDDIFPDKQSFTLSLKIMESEYDVNDSVSFFPAMSSITNGDVTNMLSTSLIYGKEKFTASGLSGSPQIMSQAERKEAAGTFTELKFNFTCDGNVEVFRKLDGQTDWYQVGVYSVGTVREKYNAIGLSVNTYMTADRPAGTIVDYWVDDIEIVYETAPTISASVPANGALNVSASDNIVIDIATPLSEESINKDNIKLYIKGSSVKRKVDSSLYDIDYVETSGGRITITPTQPLVNGETYIVSVNGLVTAGDTSILMKKAEEIEFLVPYTVEVSDYSAALSEGKISFVSKIAENENVQPYTAIAVLRNAQGAACDVYVQSGNTNTTPVDFTHTFDPSITDATGYSVSIYVWNGFTDSRRLADVKTFGVTP